MPPSPPVGVWLLTLSLSCLHRAVKCCWLVTRSSQSILQQAVGLTTRGRPKRTLSHTPSELTKPTALSRYTGRAGEGGPPFSRPRWLGDATCNIWEMLEVENRTHLNLERIQRYTISNMIDLHYQVLFKQLLLPISSNPFYYKLFYMCTCTCTKKLLNVNRRANKMVLKTKYAL